MANRYITPNKRFESKVAWNGDCLEWQGHILHNGYGQIKANGKSIKTHRFSYQLKHGEIPNGYLVLHTCDNPRCVNPDHLYLGNAKDNANDRDSRGRNGFSSKTHCKRGHEFTEDNTYLWRGKRICRKCKQMPLPSASGGERE